MSVLYKVSGMTCGGCAASVSRAIVALRPEVRVQVDLQAGTVEVAGEGADDEPVMRQAVEDAGFDFQGRA